MKLSNLLSRFGIGRTPHGERIRGEEALRTVENGYFRKIGQYFKTAQILLFVCLFLFVTIFALTNSSSITYANLYYFFKDFRTAVDNTDSSVESIPYEVDTNTTFAVYKGGLAVAGTERLRLLTASGGQNSTATLGFASPALSVSTDLLLVYSRGERECHIYNSFTKIHSDTLDGDVRTAYLSESGAYSVTMEDEEYTSAVYVYSRNFQKVNKYSLNSYVIAAPLSDDGKTVALLSYVAVDGVYETRVRLAEVGTDRSYTEDSIAGAFPLGAVFTKDDSLLVLTDNGLYRVTKKNGVTRTAEWTDGYVSAFSLTESGAVLVLRDGSSEALAISDGDGAIIRSVGVGSMIRSVGRCGDYAFYRTDTELVRVSSETGETKVLSCTESGGTLLVVSEDVALICGSGEAKYYRFRF